MKTLRIAVVLIIAAFSTYMLTSCDPESAEPTITWEGIISYNYDANEDGNYAHTLNLVVDAEAGINLFNIWKHVITDTDTVSSLVDSPADCIGLLTYDYDFVANVAPADVAGGVTKIIYEFEVTDNDLNTVTEEFVIFVTNGILSYNVTFIVKDGAGADITDAIMVFGDSTNTAGDYTLVNVPTGTYNYTVNKAGYQAVNATDFVLESDTTISVVLHKLLSAYSENVLITQSVTSSYATYEGVRVSETENTTIGVKYHTNTANTIVIKTTTNCEGWVIVDNDSYTTLDEIIAAYAAGTPVAEYELPFDYASKAYAARYFISKVDGAYLLVKYVDGFVNPNDIDGNLGNVIAFQYKF